MDYFSSQLKVYFFFFQVGRSRGKQTTYEIPESVGTRRPTHKDHKLLEKKILIFQNLNV